MAYGGDVEVYGFETRVDDETSCAVGCGLGLGCSGGRGDLASEGEAGGCGEVCGWCIWLVVDCG